MHACTGAVGCTHVRTHMRTHPRAYGWALAKVSNPVKTSSKQDAKS